MAYQKKYRLEDVHRVYKTAYREPYKWDDMLPPVILKYFETIQKAASCPIQFIFSSLLAMVSTLSGPLSKIEIHPHGQQSSLNLFFLAISAPGGGKSATFDHIIGPASEVFNTATGNKLILETYTHAGMQAHQGECKGYGLIASDEGIRVIQNIHAKQMKNEGERQFLCKTWTGKGDYTVLKEKARGYHATSMSMMLYVQPEPFLGEMFNFSGDDGLLDRLLTPVAQPHWFKSDIVASESIKLQDRYPDIVKKVFEDIYEKHKDNGLVYKFTDDAQNYFNNLADEFADEFNKQYDSANSDGPLQCTQEDIKIVCSKDPIYIARLSACVHILIRCMVCKINHETFVMSPNVSLQALKTAHKFYSTCTKQKSILWQAVTKNSDNKHATLGEVENPRDRVFRTAFKCKGPLVPPREIHKLLKGITAYETKHELEEIAKSGYGKLERRGIDGCKRDMYYKPSPGSLSENDLCFDVCKFTYDVYTAKFNDYSKTSAADYKLLRRHPQYEDLPIPDTPSSMSSTQSSQNSVSDLSQEEPRNRPSNVHVQLDRSQIATTSEPSTSAIVQTNTFMNVSENNIVQLPSSDNESHSISSPKRSNVNHITADSSDDDTDRIPSGQKSPHRVLEADLSPQYRGFPSSYYRQPVRNKGKICAKPLQFHKTQRKTSTSVPTFHDSFEDDNSSEPTEIIEITEQVLGNETNITPNDTSVNVLNEESLVVNVPDCVAETVISQNEPVRSEIESPTVTSSEYRQKLRGTQKFSPQKRNMDSFSSTQTDTCTSSYPKRYTKKQKNRLTQLN